MTRYFQGGTIVYGTYIVDRFGNNRNRSRIDDVFTLFPFVTARSSTTKGENRSSTTTTTTTMMMMKATMAAADKADSKSKESTAPAAIADATTAATANTRV